MRIDKIKLVSELTRRGMTQKQLAELSNVSRTTINYIKCGKSCSDDVGHKIADALNLDICEIVEVDQ